MRSLALLAFALGPGLALACGDSTTIINQGSSATSTSSGSTTANGTGGSTSGCDPCTCSVTAAAGCATMSVGPGGGIGGGGVGGTGGTGGAECFTSQDCPGVDDECRTRTCINELCGVDLTPAGTPAGPQALGNCALGVCDGAGNLTQQDDPSDVEDDGQECTDDACPGPTHMAKTKGTACSQGGGHLCDGGACVAFIPVKCKIGNTTYTACDGQNHPGLIIAIPMGGLCDDASDFGYCAPGDFCTVNVNGQSQGTGTCQ